MPTTRQVPSSSLELDLARGDEPRRRDVDQLAIEQVAAQQHLAGPPLELPEVELRRRGADGSGPSSRDPIDRRRTSRGHRSAPSDRRPAAARRRRRAARPRPRRGRGARRRSRAAGFPQSTTDERSLWASTGLTLRLPRCRAIAVRTNRKYDEVVSDRVLYVSRVMRLPLVGADGADVGHVVDVVLHLGARPPHVNGFVIGGVQRRRVFVARHADRRDRRPRAAPAPRFDQPQAVRAARRRAARRRRADRLEGRRSARRRHRPDARTGAVRVGGGDRRARADGGCRAAGASPR